MYFPTLTEAEPTTSELLTMIDKLAKHIIIIININKYRLSINLTFDMILEFKFKLSIYMLFNYIKVIPINDFK